MRSLVFIFLILGTSSLIAQTPANDSHYELIWSDEFDSTAIDTDKWLTRDWFDNGAGHTDAYSPESSKLSIQLEDNIEVSGGTLKLHLKRETISCGTDYNAEWGHDVNNLSNDSYCSFQEVHGVPYEFTGAELTTDRRTDYQYTYGYYEARLRMPFMHGAWNSFWTFRGNDVPATGDNAGEIDIFETLGRFDNPNLIKTNIHLDFCEEGDPAGFAEEGIIGGEPDECGTKGIGDLCFGVPSYDENVCTYNYEDWHTYGMELTPKHILWYIDGELVRFEENPGIHDDLWVEFGLVADPNFPPTDPTNFDVIHEVDYFRFYKLKAGCEVEVNDCSFYFGGYENTVKKRIRIGEGGCNNVQPIGTNLILRADEDVTLFGEFEVPLGAELYIDVNNCYE